MKKASNIKPEGLLKPPYGIRSGVPCNHKWIFLRTIKGIPDSSYDKDVFYCEKCLQKKAIKEEK